MTSLKYPHEYKTTADRCVIRVDNNWYDCTAWRHAHPGGAQIVDQYHGKDATDAFYALHSQDAILRLRKMKCQPIAASDAPRAPISQAFEELRHKLEREGWFRRQYLVELRNAVIPLLLIALGVLFSKSHPLIAVMLVGVGMQQVAWISHDYAHMRGYSCFVLANICAGVNGMSRGWWGNKHNTHHAFPNRVEIDSDIHNEPILHLWFPPPGRDVWYRRYQHLYYPIAYAFLMVSWRMQSALFALSSKNWVERIVVALSYVWMFALLPVPVALGSVLVCGFLVAIVVTANHQTEAIIPTAAEYNFVRDQFVTTRGVVCGNFLTEYLFGGMQYQLEHHLFPTMPRYYFPALRPIIREFAAKNGMQYHMSGVAEILRLNYNVMKACAAANTTKG